MPNNIHLSNEYSKSNNHRNGDDGEVNTCKVKASYADVLSGENISP